MITQQQNNRVTSLAKSKKPTKWFSMREWLNMDGAAQFRARAQFIVKISATGRPA